MASSDQQACAGSVPVHTQAVIPWERATICHVNTRMIRGKLSSAKRKYCRSLGKGK